MIKRTLFLLLALSASAQSWLPVLSNPSRIASGSVESHVYWRVSTTSSNWVAFKELSLLTDAGTIYDASHLNADAGIASVVYSTQYAPPSYGAANINDDTLNNEWISSNTSATHWIGYEFSSPTAVVKVGFYGHSTNGRMATAPWDLEYSDNGTDWTKLGSGMTTTKHSEWMYFLPNGGIPGTSATNHGMWRLYAASTNNGFLVNEIRLHDSTSDGLGDTTLTLGNVVNGMSDSILSATYNANYGFDENPSTTAATAQTVEAHWIGVQLDAAVAAPKKVIIEGHGHATLYANGLVSLQYSDDGENWTTVGTPSNIPRSTMPIYWVPNSDVPGTDSTHHAFWRLRASDTNGGMIFYEMYLSENSSGTYGTDGVDGLVVDTMGDAQLGGSYLVEHVMDGDLGTVYGSTSAAGEHHVGVQLSEAKEIVRVGIYSHNHGSYYINDDAFLEYSDDGLNWTQHGSAITVAPSTSGWQYFNP